MPSPQPIVDEPVLSNEFGNQFLYSINGDTFTHQSATVHFNEILTERFWAEESYHVVAGTDSGLLIEHIVNGGIPKNSIYLFVECGEYIDLIRPDLNEEWQQVLKFCTPEEWEAGYDHETAAAYFYNDKVILHYSSAVRHGRSDLYHQLKLRLDFIYKNKVYENSAGLGNRDFIACQLNNVAHNINSSQLLKGAFEGKPCVILGGGPSLDEHLPWVIENQDNLVIIAVARISRRLQEVGLIPDIVIALDPQQISFDVSKEIYNFPPEVLLLNSYHVIPKLVSQWQGKSAYFGDRVPWESKLNAPKHFQEGPTVVNAALIAAVDLGCKEVYLTGADMCYGPNGATHATSSFESEREIDIGRDSQWLETYAGHKAETIIPLILTANYLSKHAKYANENDVTVYNLSRNALKLDFIEYKEINSISLISSQETTKEIIGKLIPSNSTDGIRRELNELNKEFEKVKKDLSSVELLAKEAIVATNKAYDAKSTEKQAQSNKQKIEKSERKIKQHFGYLDKLLKTLAFRDFAKILMGGRASTLLDHELARRNITYYQAYINGVDELRKMLVPTQQRLTVLSNAYSKSIKIEEVCDYFCQQQEFGIGKVISNNRGDELDREIKLLLDTMSESQSEYQNRISKSYQLFNHGIGGVYDKIRRLAKERDQVGLIAVIEFLGKSKGDANRVSYLITLGQAFNQLLEGNNHNAVNLFSQIEDIGLSQWDREQFVNALIACEKYSKAMSLLESLVANNLGLNRLYGQLLVHHKSYEQAVEAYSSYLEVFKQDIDAWIELGSVFIEIAAFESALMAYDFILSLDVNNQFALEMKDKLQTYFDTKASS